MCFWYFLDHFHLLKIMWPHCGSNVNIWPQHQVWLMGMLLILIENGRWSKHLEVKIIHHLTNRPQSASHKIILLVQINKESFEMFVHLIFPLKVIHVIQCFSPGSPDGSRPSKTSRTAPPTILGVSASRFGEEEFPKTSHVFFMG